MFSPFSAYQIKQTTRNRHRNNSLFCDKPRRVFAQNPRISFLSIENNAGEEMAVLGLILAARSIRILYFRTISRHTETTGDNRRREEPHETYYNKTKIIIFDNCEDRASRVPIACRWQNPRNLRLHSVDSFLFFFHFIFGFRWRQCCAAHVKCGRRPHSHRTWMHHYLWVRCGACGAPKTSAAINDVVFQLRIAAHFIKFLIWTCRRNHTCGSGSSAEAGGSAHVSQ